MLYPKYVRNFFQVLFHQRNVSLTMLYTVCHCGLLFCFLALLFLAAFSTDHVHLLHVFLINLKLSDIVRFS